jgi:hypothetical protein
MPTNPEQQVKLQIQAMLIGGLLSLLLLFSTLFVVSLLCDAPTMPNEPSSPTAAPNAVNGGQTKKETKCQKP